MIAVLGEVIALDQVHRNRCGPFFPDKLLIILNIASGLETL
jgi:hypothetical protein